MKSFHKSYYYLHILNLLEDTYPPDVVLSKIWQKVFLYQIRAQIGYNLRLVIGKKIIMLYSEHGNICQCNSYDGKLNVNDTHIMCF